MRLFVAIELDDRAREAVAAEQQRVRDALADGCSQTWIPVDRIHLTLAFLGEVVAPQLPDVVSGAALPLDAAPFTLTFAGLGTFPPRGAPRVVWLGTTVGSSAAAAVQRIVADRLLRAGIALERRPFHPHLTLARLRRARPPDAGRIRAIDSGQAIARVSVDHVTLFESRLAPRGAVYTAVAHGPLIGGAAPPVQ
jgi:RNA 2',3'-cyclic 3'-phosphodiesterase